MTTERIERTFETGPEAEVEISNMEGSIDVRGWDRPVVEVVAQKADKNSDTSVEIGGEGQRVWAKTHTGRPAPRLLGWLKGSERTSRVDYTVRVPRATRLTVSNVSGPVTVTDVQDSITVDSVNGEISLIQVAGDLAATTVNGSVHGQAVQGTLAVETVSGAVELQEGHLTRLRAESIDGQIVAAGQIDNLEAEAINGTIHITSPLHPAGTYSVKTVNGHFHLTVPEDTSCRISASGINVDVTCELPHTVERQEWGHWSGHIRGGGDAHITFDTVNGTLTIENAPSSLEDARSAVTHELRWESTPATEAVNPPPGAAEATSSPPLTTRMEILQALERGEIQVEEALERLRQL